MWLLTQFCQCPLRARFINVDGESVIIIMASVCNNMAAVRRRSDCDCSVFDATATNARRTSAEEEGRYKIKNNYGAASFDNGFFCK